MIIAIASRRGPKVEAVRQVFPLIQKYLAPSSVDTRYLTYNVNGGISMPRSTEELMTGAKRRVEALQRLLANEKQPADFFIGMEGGFHQVHHNDGNHVFLQSWAYASNGLVGFFGSSGNVVIPEKIAREVMEYNRELGEVIDEATQTSDIRSKQGTWGVLTRDLLTRQESFETALKAAFAPFYNADLYR